MGSRNVDRDKPICSEHVRLAYLSQEFPDWALSVSCRGCTHSVHLYPERLMKRLGKSARIGDLLARLKCRHCGCQLSVIKPVFVGKRRD